MIFSATLPAKPVSRYNILLMRNYTEENRKLLDPDRHELSAEPGGPHGRAAGIHVMESRKPGAPTLKVSSPDGEMHLHSSYDPPEEARRWAERQLRGRGTRRAVVFGFGLGYHVEALLELFPEMENLTVIEVNPGVFSAALAARPLEKILSDPRVRIIAGPYPSVADRIRNAIDEFSAGGDIGVFVHRPSLNIFPADAADLRDILEYILLSASDTPVFSSVKKDNIEKNRLAFETAPGVAELFGSMAGKPAVVAAAGPSLDTSLDLLKTVSAPPAIIAVDSALAPFHAAGLHPDFVVTGDPQPEVMNLFRNLEPAEEKLVFFPTSCPEAVEFFHPPRRLAAYSSVHPDGGPAESERDRDLKGELFLSGTVFLAAVDFAVKCGAGPVAVIGADFSFTQDRTHAAASRTQGYSPRYGRLRETPGIHGNPVQTADILFLYLRDFEKYCAGLAGNPEIVNCTARGAAVSGVQPISFDAFLKKQG